ncbi:MAG: enoyl-CoA hydratase-related protein [Myxococcota bacterium]|nr:enoyl-CoA hydratase-related protein [Myxococcota bacterium]
MSYETLEYELRDGVAFITLAREKAANALNLTLCEELADAALMAEQDPSARAVVLGARGKMFCAGGDLSAMAESADAPVLLRKMTLHLHAAIALLARMDAPVIAAVNGTAAGAGFSLACATDLAVAGESAKFTMAYTRAGLTPDGSSTWFMPRLIGRRLTLELMLTNRLLSAEEARDLGLVNQVVPDDQVAGVAAELAAKLAQGPTRSFGAVKRLVLSSGDQGLETQMELESAAIAAAGGTADGQEGVAAFLAKRAPKFTGA